jgi:hypothetical protein
MAMTSPARGPAELQRNATRNENDLLLRIWISLSSRGRRLRSYSDVVLVERMVDGRGWKRSRRRSCLEWQFLWVLVASQARIGALEVI